MSKIKDEFFNEDLTIADRPAKPKLEIVESPLQLAVKKYKLNFKNNEELDKFLRQKEVYKNKFKILKDGQAYIGEVKTKIIKDNSILFIEYLTYGGLKQHYIHDEFITTYEKETKTADGISKKEVAYTNNSYQNIWIKDRATKDYERVVFMPDSSLVEPNELNIWQGFIEPKEGDITPFNEFLDGLLVHSEDKEELIKHLAYMVQHPDEPGQRFTIFKGDKGCGKSFICKHIIGRLSPYHFLSAEGLELLFGKWNYLTEYSKIILLDEITAKQVAIHMDQIKATTGNSGMRTIRRRHSDERQILNILTIFATSDNKQAFTSDGENERRLHIIKVSNKYKYDVVYYAGLKQWLDNSGINYILNYLLNYELGEWSPRLVVDNEEKDKERLYSLSPILQKLVDIGNNEFHKVFNSLEVNWTETGLRLEKIYFEKTLQEEGISQTQLTRLLNKIFKFEDRHGKNWNKNLHGRFKWDSLYQYQQDLAEHLGLSVECLYEGNIEPLPTSEEADRLFEDNYGE